MYLQVGAPVRCRRCVTAGDQNGSNTLPTLCKFLDAVLLSSLSTQQHLTASEIFPVLSQTLHTGSAADPFHRTHPDNSTAVNSQQLASGTQTQKLPRHRNRREKWGFFAPWLLYQAGNEGQAEIRCVGRTRDGPGMTWQFLLAQHWHLWQERLGATQERKTNSTSCVKYGNHAAG